MSNNPFRQIYLQDLQELSKKQKKIDVNHNGKIEGSDLAALRAKKPVEEELKGGQKKIDKNHNGKLDGQDFAILRSKKKTNEEAEHIDEKITVVRNASDVRPASQAGRGDVHVPTAPSPDKKYIKGTPEHKANKEAQKPRTGHPTGSALDRVRSKMKKEEVEITEGTYSKDVERAFPASGVKTGPSAPKGTSTMPKDKEKAKGQPANKMSEEAEQIDELSKGTLNSYLDKAKRNRNTQSKAMSRAYMNDDDKYDDAEHKRDQRNKGITAARNKLKEESDKPVGKGGKVETKKYSWGTMKTVHHGADFSIPLHPEHHQAIAKLKDQQEHKFKDETGRHWTAKKSGEHVHFQGANGGGTTHVPAHTMHEDYQGEIAEADRPGLYANINAKRKRIEAGSGERMRKPGSKGAPSAQDFKDAAKTAKEETVYDYLKRLNEATKKCPECGKAHKGSCDDYMKKEEVEQIDELSKSTLGSYVKKASHDATINRSIASDFEHMAKSARKISSKIASTELAGQYKAKSWKRKAGIGKAVDRLTKEEVISEAKPQKTADRYHINHPDRPATLASYKDKQSAIKDRDAKYPGAKVHQVGPRGKIKATFEETEQIHEISDKSKENYLSAARADRANNKQNMASGDSLQRVAAKERDKKRMAGMNKARAQLTPGTVANRKVEARRTANEEFEQIDELSKSTLGSYATKAADDAHKFRSMNKGKRRLAGIKKAVDRLTKEEVQLDEANHREFASHGLMHPDMAKHMTVGQHQDYYEPKTGDKVHGKVIHKSDKEVHVKQTHDSYDPKKAGTVHKFKVSKELPKMNNEETEMEFTQEELKLIEQFIEIAEKLNMSKASMGDVIKDFKKSDAPQFAGKSVEKRRQMAIAAKLSADRTKKEETTSFKGFLQKLEEIKLSDLPVRKVSGSYGTSYYKGEAEKDKKGYDDEEGPSHEAKEKRGRGRPKGAASGARQKGSTTGKKRSGVEMTGYPLHLPNSK